jgi:hypothetical protein
VYRRLTIQERLLMFPNSTLDLRSSKISLNVNTTFEPSISPSFSTYSKEASAGFISLASKNEVIEAKVNNKAVTPNLLPIYVSSKLSALIKSIVTVRLSLLPDSPVPDRSTSPSSTSLYLHPYGGNEVAVYDTTTNQWILAPLATGSSPQQFNLFAIGATLPNTLYDIYAFNNGDFDNPVIGLQCVPWTGGNTIPPAKSYQNGAEVLASDPSRRYIGLIKTTNAGESVIDLGGIRYLPDNMVIGVTSIEPYTQVTGANYNSNYYAQVRTYYNFPTGTTSMPKPARCFLANAFNTYDVSLVFFFGTGWDSGWNPQNSIPNSMPPYYQDSAQCQFVLAQRQLTTAFADIYSNPNISTWAGTVLYVMFGVNSTSQAAPDGFFGEGGEPNQTSTTCWARTLNPGYNYIQYLYTQGGTNWVNEHPSHGLIVTTKV